MAETRECPLCRRPSGLFLATTDLNRRVSGVVFEYYRCGSCGLVFLARVPEDLARYYPDGYHVLPRSRAELERIGRRTQYQIELVSRFVSGGRLLEIGPGFGSFAFLAKSAGFEVEAVERDADCCNFLEKVVGVTVTRSDSPSEILSRSGNRYDAIVLWHVVEHLPEPWKLLQHASEAVSPGGILLVATPNPLAWQFKVLGPQWPHVDAPRHLYLIPFAVIREQVEARGLKCVLVTTNDRGGLAWNRFGWGQAVVNLMPVAMRRSWLLRGVAAAVGGCIATAAAAVERRDLQGSAYTAVFQKSAVGQG